MKNSFLVHDSGRLYRVTLRNVYQRSIINEKKFREVVEKSTKKQYGEAAFDMSKKTIWYYAGTVLGMITMKQEVKLNLKTNEWEVVK